MTGKKISLILFEWLATILTVHQMSGRWLFQASTTLQVCGNWNQSCACKHTKKTNLAHRWDWHQRQKNQGASWLTPEGRSAGLHNTRLETGMVIWQTALVHCLEGFHSQPQWLNTAHHAIKGGGSLPWCHRCTDRSLQGYARRGWRACRLDRCPWSAAVQNGHLSWQSELLEHPAHLWPASQQWEIAQTVK